MRRDRFYDARLLAPSVSSFTASMSAPLFREIPSAPVMSPNTQSRIVKPRVPLGT